MKQVTVNRFLEIKAERVTDGGLNALMSNVIYLCYNKSEQSKSSEKPTQKSTYQGNNKEKEGRKP